MQLYLVHNKLILSVEKFQESCPYIDTGSEDKNKTHTCNRLV